MSFLTGEKSDPENFHIVNVLAKVCFLETEKHGVSKVRVTKIRYVVGSFGAKICNFIKSSCLCINIMILIANGELGRLTVY